MPRNTRFRYDSNKEDTRFIDLNHQMVLDEKNRCATRKFEARYIKIARGNNWRVFPYIGGGGNNGQEELGHV